MTTLTEIGRAASGPGSSPRAARGGTLILGGGFGGAYVARLLGGATIVSPESSLLYTPLLPEVAAGAVEPRHVFVPLRMMCPDAELLHGRAVTLEAADRVVTVGTEHGTVEVTYERLVIALGSSARMLPVPGWPSTPSLQGPRRRHPPARPRDPPARLRRGRAPPRRPSLTFVFVGAGYAGVEALAETRQLVQDALRHYPDLRQVRQRWVLVEAGGAILPEVPVRLAAYTTARLRRLGVEILTSSTVTSVEEHAVTLDSGRRLATETLVWAAGTSVNPLVATLGLPLDDRGRVRVDGSLRVHGRADVWALGDCAAVPNAATPGAFDPPTCQHAVRQARAVAASLTGHTRPYRYRSIGEGATLGRRSGIARVFGLHVRGRLGAWVTRGYHLQAIPVPSRRLRVLADGVLSTVLRRDIAELGTAAARRELP